MNRAGHGHLRAAAWQSSAKEMHSRQPSRQASNSGKVRRGAGPPWWLRDIVIAGLLAGLLFASQVYVDDARADRERAAAVMAATLADRRENLRFVRDHASPLLVPRSFVSIDLTDQKLPGLLLEGADFGEGSLSGADMSYAFLKGARFQNTDLASSKLVFAGLEDSFMSHANLHSADVSDAKMQRADLTDADLTGASLRDVDLSDANLPNANMSTANLSRSILKNANLPGAIFSKAKLVDADLSNANLSRVIFTGADLSGAIISGADFEGADLRLVTFETARGLGSAKLDKACFDSTTRWPPSFDVTSVVRAACPD